MASNSILFPDLSIRTHHIKSLHTPPAGECYFLTSQPSMFLLEKSLCEQKRNQTQAIMQSQQTQGLYGENTKNLKGSSRDLLLQTNIVVGDEDINKLLTQLVQKGKKVQTLFKPNIISNPSTFSKQQFQKYSHENTYLKSTAHLLLNEYFKKRKLGPKLRGLNADLLNEIQAKLFNLIQAEFNIWSTTKQTVKIDADFNIKVKQMQDYLQKMKQQIIPCFGI